MNEQPTKIVCLISGGGRTVKNLAECIDRGELNIEIAAVISSRGDVYGIERCQGLGLTVYVVDRNGRMEGHKKGHKSPTDFTDEIWSVIRSVDAQIVCLCGFMHLLTIPDDYAGKVLNIHPALLPKFGGQGMYGHHVHEAVLAAGETASGCTVHLCDNEYDTGPTLVQRSCPVMEGDTPDALAARVFEQECIAYPAAIRKLIEDHV